MDIFRYIFFLGIVYIVFSIIWFFIALLPKYLLGSSGGQRQNDILSYIIKAVQYYFLASLTAMKAIDFVAKENLNESQGPLYIVVGGIVLYLYLAGKLERNKVMFQFRSNLANLKTGSALKYEPHLIGVTLVFYAITFSQIQLIQNPINSWFLVSIDDFYNTVIIGWIIGFVGFLFLISMVVKGINATGFLVQTIVSLATGKPAPQRKQKNPFGKFGGNSPFGNQAPFGGGESFGQNEPEDVDIDDDMYVDFEVMDEDEDNDDEKGS